MNSKDMTRAQQGEYICVQHNNNSCWDCCERIKALESTIERQKSVIKELVSVLEPVLNGMEWKSSVFGTSIKSALESARKMEAGL